jgi:hypothetical protein
MIKIAHRVNSVELLKSVPKEFGVEIDIRSRGSQLILRHDIGDEGCSLNEYLNNYHHEIIIFNVKEDGLEDSILEAASTVPRLEYFFLDQPFPSIIRTSTAGYSTAVRVSEFESLPAKPIPCKWIWLDSFTGSWAHLDSTLEYAKQHNLRTCLVAPELQGRYEKSENDFLHQRYSDKIDAICTKDPAAW